MKKLMIVAVAVAMAGVASAAEVNSYKFTATLKTTKGKVGKAGVTKDKVDYPLSMSSEGKIWYNDDAFTKGDLTNLVYKIDGKRKFALHKKDGFLDPAYCNGNFEYFQVLLIDLSKKYSLPDATGTICEKFRTKWEYPEQCYRVVGSRKLTADLCATNCCNEFKGLIAITTNVAAKANGGIFWDWDPSKKLFGLCHWFGSQDSTKCNKIEVYAPVVEIGDFVGALAGQGAFSKGAIKSISGNIVGALYAPICVECCTSFEALPVAIAFNCAGDGVYDPDSTLSKTAAFGTFRVKADGQKTVTLAD